jgi:hypothetical protein
MKERKKERKKRAKRDGITVDVLKEFASNENSSTDTVETCDEVLEYMKINYQKGEKCIIVYVSTIVTFITSNALDFRIINNW